MTPPSQPTLILDTMSDRHAALERTNDVAMDAVVNSRPTSSYSSIHETALALVVRASEQAGIQAAVPYCEPSSHQEEIAEERRKSAIHRATEEQARRVADCSRTAFQSLLRHLQQPCLALDESGRITLWNSALEHASGIPTDYALDKPLEDLFALEAALQIRAANLALRDEIEFCTNTEPEPAFT